MKPFKTIDEQIDLLKSRGMTFNDLQLARNFLLRKNYYNTANVYGKYLLQEHESNRYKLNASFDDICAMYDFEKKLRDHMFNVLMTVEANVSSTMAHLFSKKFPKSNSYMNIKNYCSTCEDKQFSNWAFIQGRISRILSDSKKDKSKSNSIQHHLKNYNSVPLWVIVNDLTFGNIVSLFRAFDTDLKREIAESFEELLSVSYDTQVHLTPTETQDYLDALTNLRNKVAHDSCLSVYRTHHGKHIRLNDLNRAEYPDVNSKRTKFYDVMLVSRFFISKNAFYRFLDNILEEIKFLENRINDKTILSPLMEDLGFNFYT